MGTTIAGAALGGAGGAGAGLVCGTILEKIAGNQEPIMRYITVGAISGCVVGAVKAREEQAPKPIDHTYDPSEL